MHIAIVGAGIAGLACAERLGRDGHATTLFDKGRGAGGRMATRRVRTEAGEVAFDHGAQYVTARDPAFVDQLGRWRAEGVAARWPAAGPDAWVGTPGMSAMVGAMAATATVRWGERVAAFARRDGRWFLDGRGEAYDAVVVAVPAEQAAALLSPHDPAFAAVATACVSAPCWTAMAALPAPLAIRADIVRDAGVIGWAARNSAKPGRAGPEAWVVQATPQWSRDHLEDEPGTVAVALLAALADRAGAATPEPIVRLAHRWRYARASTTGAGSLWNPGLRLGAAGDWLAGPRVEAAWLSGRALGGRIAAG